MNYSKILTQKQLEAIGFLAKGESKLSVAAKIGVSPATLNRWNRDPVYQAELASAYFSGLEATMKMVNIVTLTSLETLQEFLCDMLLPHEFRLKAALGVLHNAPRLNSALEKNLKHRLADFTNEEKFAGGNTFDAAGNLTRLNDLERPVPPINDHGGVKVYRRPK